MGRSKPVFTSGRESNGGIRVSHRNSFRLSSSILLACILSITAFAEPEQRKAHIHAPYKDRDCKACHEGDLGLVLKAPEGGLCLASCHLEVVAEAEFLHGPLNLNDCMPCHDYHESDHVSLLRLAPGELCALCHRKRDFATESHRTGRLERACTDCHDPHRGKDRFFQKATTDEESPR